MNKTARLLVLLAATSMSQELVWIRPFTGVYGNDFLDVAVDTRDNVIVTAMNWIWKFSPDGECLWARPVNLPLPGVTLQVATDLEDNIVVGKAMSDTTWEVRKLAPAGESLWSWQTGWPSPETYLLTDIATDSRGRVVVVGHRPGTYSGMWFTFQLTPEGSTNWLRTFSSNWGIDFARGACVDPADNVIVGGCRGIRPRDRQSFPSLVKYSEGGETLAEVVYDPYPFAANLMGYRPATDPEENIILAGGGTIWDTTGARAHWYGGCLLKHDPQGNVLWQWFSDTARDGACYFYGCQTDTAGNTYIAGPRTLPDSSLVIDLRQFRPDGDTSWTFYCGLQDDYSPSAPLPGVSLAVDHRGDIIAVSKNMRGPPHDTGYIFKIRGQTAIAEPGDRRAARSCRMPTVAHGSLSVQSPALTRQSRIVLLDVSGRKVLDLCHGPNDVRRLAPGVYFIQLVSGLETQKVVIAE